MNRRIYKYLKTVVLVLLLMEAVSPHHHHFRGSCCLLGQCEQAPLNRNCQETESGERVMIWQGEKAVCPTWMVMIPLLLLAIAGGCLWNDAVVLKNICHFGKWHLLYLPGQLYGFKPLFFNFLRPPPAVL